ncbi:MAG: BLUF domain-containing protein [Gammaproteobacteria bacterium]|nr:MAG: BLUF domain-containing protein [Gammaproteobacteria bacterium]
MICMVYISSAVLGLSDREIGGIVKVAQRNNEELNITGILLYNGGSFMQLIEGEDEKVERLYERIKNDPRHTNVTLLLKEKITHKNFERWFMGFRDVQNFINIEPEIASSFLNDEFNFSIHENNPHRALTFLNTFKKIIK